MNIKKKNGNLEADSSSSEVLPFIFNCIVSFLVLVTIFYIRFENPTLTETQLLLNYWELWLSILGFVLINQAYWTYVYNHNDGLENKQ